MAEKLYLTTEGENRIKKELEDLCGPQREAIAKRLRDAIQMGDLSENADYHKAKEDQSFLEGRIQELDYVLRNAIIVETDTLPKDAVSVGCFVTIQENGFEPETYHIVGAKEADPRVRKISNASPLGSALMERKVGDTVEANTPDGNITLKIIKIE